MISKLENDSMKSFSNRKSKCERTKLRNSFRFHHIMKAHKPQPMVTDIHFLNINYSSFYFAFSFFYLGLETLQWFEKFLNSFGFLQQNRFMARTLWEESKQE